MRGLTVIILSRNDSNLDACLGVLPKREPEVRVRIVDDGLQTPTGIPGPKPFIFARNANIGICAAFDDDVVLLNDDALLETPGGFTAMQRAAVEYPEYGVIAAATNVVGNPEQQQRPGGGLREAQRGDVCFICVLIPRRTIERVGLLDESFTDYAGEDTEYCYRVRQAGLNIGIFDGCFVDHSKLESTFRPGNGSRSIDAAMRRFREIHGQEMFAC